MDKLLIICGPTAVGKTDLAIQLAKHFGGEIISSDSRHVYRGMDIGTGKDIDKSSKLKIHSENFTVGFREKEGIPIWLVDIVDPDYLFNVGEYTQLAKQVREDIRLRHKLPIIVGGTGLYIKSLIEPLSFVYIPPDRIMREQLERRERGELEELLKKENRKRWEMMNQSDRKNPRRLIRAIEITRYMKKYPFSIYRKIDTKANILLIGLYAPLNQLYARIDKRVDERIESGVEKEIRKLILRGFHWENSALGVTIGYREWRDYFENKRTKEEVIQRWKYAEHSYARRQMTWFRKQKNMYWFDITDTKYLKKIEENLAKWYTSN